MIPGAILQDVLRGYIDVKLMVKEKKPNGAKNGKGAR